MHTWFVQNLVLFGEKRKNITKYPQSPIFHQVLSFDLQGTKSLVFSSYNKKKWLIMDENKSGVFSPEICTTIKERFFLEERDWGGRSRDYLPFFVPTPEKFGVIYLPSVPTKKTLRHKVL